MKKIKYKKGSFLRIIEKAKNGGFDKRHERQQKDGNLEYDKFRITKKRRFLTGRFPAFVTGNRVDNRVSTPLQKHSCIIQKIVYLEKITKKEKNKMARCNYCEQEMKDEKTVSCTGNTEVKFPDEKLEPSVPAWQDCPDCAIKADGFHHPGCDQERCPRCNSQLISCGCLFEGEDDD